jgi:hypothetical protein
MRDVPTEIDDLLRSPLLLGSSPVANAPVRYRALELGDIRFGWTMAPYLRPVAAGTSLPGHYSMVLRLSTMGEWRVEELKGFEWAEHAERWARALWRDATRIAHRGGTPRA